MRQSDASDGLVNVSRPCVRLALAAVLTVIVSACGGGGGASNTPAAPDAAAQPTLSISSSAGSTSPGGMAITLRAATLNSSTTPLWTLNGPGSLSGTSGQTVQYLPPDAEVFNTPTTVTVTGAIGAVTSSLSLTLTAASVQGHTWEIVHAPGMNWHAVSHGGGNFVAIGDQGFVDQLPDGRATLRRVLYQSSDGASWAPRILNGSYRLVSAAWGSHGWIAIDNVGGVLHSADGITWTETDTPLFRPGQADATAMEQVVFGNGVYLAMGQNAVYVSSDGANWTRRATGLFGSLAFGSGVFVATPLLWNGGPPSYSSDGLVWTAAQGAPWHLTTIAFGNGRFVASDGGAMQAYSADGITWTAYTAPQAVEGQLAFAGDGFFAAGTSSLSMASDGTQWGTLVTSDFIHPLTGVAANSGTYVRVSSMGSIGVSLNGSDWTDVVEGSIGTLQSVDFANGTYVAVSDQGWSLTSTDGRQWARHYLFTGVPYQTLNARAVAHGGGVFVACGQTTIGSTGLVTNTAITFVVSDDGMRWSPASSPSASGSCTAITHDGARFLATTDGGDIYVSIDGRAWNKLAALPNAPRLNGLTHGNGRYVAVGDNGYVAASDDAVAWNIAPVINSVGSNVPSYSIHGIAYDGARFVVVGQAGTAAHSTDGLNWTINPTGVGADLMALSYSGGQFVAVGRSGNAISSRDGVGWYARDPQTRLDLLGLVFANGGFTAVGGNSVITSSDH